ncbi:MAG TPA: GC-type dockerin domain-anchored protein [Phycisphaerales bacterium]|nr:GC-type dockerin domain-anchored protein [Phycisphaerales bacterium]
MGMGVGRVLSAGVLVAVCGSAHGQVFLNEVFFNPPGSANDDTREFIEIHGTPFRKLDGYAVAVMNGTQTKHYRLDSLGAGGPADQEIDEFFSLDGLSLGANGILVIGIGASSSYPTLLTDTNFQRWNTIWNGLLDTPGKLNNDGSNTIMLVRNRPGVTQANPSSPLGLRWGKDVDHDAEYLTPVEGDVCSGGSAAGNPCNDTTDCLGAPCEPGFVDQFGDGELDRGNPDGYGGFTNDAIGFLTPGDVSDDLEIVDELAYEHDQGWEYDTDDRRVDVGSASGAFKQRKVHSLDDPQGLNPDAVTRVDYRTKGAGWTPVAGAVGEGPGGKNWQDTATEQWIRGESFPNNSPPFYYDNSANADPNAAQPYLTQVPRWLADGAGVEYSFTASSYEIAAGRVNPLSVAFIPGDVNRDGVCDGQDIAKVASVFGDADWIFSNAWGTSPQTNEGDPALQTRPWDVDGTGDNGIEPSDLQWTLNFQGNTNGRIVGVRYDSTTPAASGVSMNSNASTTVAVSAALDLSCGVTADALYIGDVFTMVVSARVTGGANNSAGQQNGVMQFIHDVTVSTGGVVRVLSVTPMSTYQTTRESLQAPAGNAGDLGIGSVNGYTTSFTEGLGADAPLYVVTFEAVGYGSADIGVRADDAARIAASTPRGVKLGHTLSQGNPAAASYPSLISVSVINECRSDFDRSGFTDTDDFDAFVEAFEAGEQCADFDLTGFVDTDDFDAFVEAFEAGC